MTNRILLVDDEPNILKAFKWLFSDEPYEVLTYDNPLEALDALDDTEVAVVVSDQRMPEMEGTEFLEHVKKKRPDTLRIILTAYADINAALSAINKGNVYQFIMKPWDDTELKMIVRKAVSHYELVAENRHLHELTKKQNERLRNLNQNFKKMVASQTSELKQNEERLKRTLQDLRKAMGGTIQAMALTVETTDPYTAGHQRRTTNLARSIARKMRLSEREINAIRTGGSIHDLGKIAVPLEILSKPTRLTNIEFDLIKTHPQVGYDILKGIEFPWPIAEIVRQHHERIDGSGYPQGIKGDDILLEARVLAVADVVEAMSSHRPYRPALGMDKALEEILRNRGILYDPHVVDACLALLAKSAPETDRELPARECDPHDGGRPIIRIE